MNFGDILRNLLDERNLTQKELAAQLNMAPSTIGNYIRNYREPDLSTVKLLAKFFNVSTDYLLDFRTRKTYTYQEDELLRIFRSLSPEQKEVYIAQGKPFLKVNNREKTTNSPTT